MRAVAWKVDHDDLVVERELVGEFTDSGPAVQQIVEEDDAGADTESFVGWRRVHRNPVGRFGRGLTI